MNPTLRLWAVCIIFAFGAGIPNIGDMFYPNNAQIPIEKYLLSAIYGENQNSSSNGTSIEDSSSAVAEFVYPLFVELFAIGLFLSAFPVSHLCDRYGRKTTILISVFLSIPGHAAQLIAGKVPIAWPLLFVGRFLAMFAQGLYQVSCPIFINEISPAKNRGALGVTQPIALTLGTFIATVLGLHVVFGSDNLWPYAYAVFTGLSILVIPVLLSVPDSPNFLAARHKGEKRQRKVEKSLNFYHGNLDSYDTVLRDVGNSSSSKKSESCLLLRKVYRLVTLKALKRSVLVSVFISIAYSEIFILNSYSTAMMVSAGVDKYTASYCTVGMKALSFLVFLACLFTVDKFGRRPILLMSLFGSAIGWTATTIFQEAVPGSLSGILVIISLFVVQFFMNIGIRPLMFVVIPEVFPYEYRSTGKVFSILMMYIFLMGALFGFPPLLETVSGYAYLLISIPVWISSVVIAVLLPETKQKAPDEIFPELANLQGPVLPTSSVVPDTLKPKPEFVRQNSDGA